MHYWNMVGRLKRLRRRSLALLLGLVLLLGTPLALAAPGLVPPRLAVIDWMGQTDAQALLRAGLTRAEQAGTLARSARTAADWDAVMTAWLGAIATFQSVPPDAPERAFVQRQQREYLQALGYAQQQAHAASLPYAFPNLGSPVLNEQLVLYLSYVATVGPPDVLIIGSSRALQGIDPEVLQQALVARGIENPTVYNFSVNGATAQVLNFVLQRLLPAQLPRLVLWGTGSRGFNSARFDATFANILSSPGYQAAQTGARPQLDPSRRSVVTQPSALTSHGFLPVPAVFSRDRYYQSFPRVEGRFDGFYNPFRLTGLQDVSLASLAQYLRSRSVALVIVNLPLSGDYLDDFRLRLERQFQQFLQSQGERLGFSVVDLLTQLTAQDQLFADPSHLNQAGAAAIARQLAEARPVLAALANRSPSP